MTAFFTTPDDRALGTLLDVLIDSVRLQRGPVERADMIFELLVELRAAIEWSDSDETADVDTSTTQELASLGRLVSEAHEHQQRMRILSRDSSSELGQLSNAG